MAFRITEDTEFRDALIARGIIPDPNPPKESSPSASPSILPKSQLPISRSPSPDLIAQLEDEISTQDLEVYRNARLKEMKKKEEKMKFGEVREIGKSDYNDEVVEGSKGTPVVCCLYQDYLPLCKLLLKHLRQIAAEYPSTKFLSIIASRCIENYPDQACPTILVYKDGEMLKQVVGLGKESDQFGQLRGMQTSLKDIENLLISIGAVDSELKISRSSNSRGEEEEEDSDGEDKPKRGIRVSKMGGLEDDFDL